MQKKTAALPNICGALRKSTAAVQELSAAIPNTSTVDTISIARWRIEIGAAEMQIMTQLGWLTDPV